jgi:NAD(P)-dependent dehydrogenase (short-subunit alcohol dehydrogenase family)
MSSSELTRAMRPSILSLSGKTAVVIGGTSGLGLAIAKGLAQAGADVVPTSRSRSSVESACSEIRQIGCDSIAVTCDVKDPASIELLLDATCEEFGQVHILVNCAGITKRMPILEMEESDWKSILQTNLDGTFRACKVFGREMTKRGYGRIINIASLSSFISFFEVAAYSASKAAVASLTRSLAVEWARCGVCANAIVPGVFRTSLNAVLLDGTPRGQELRMRTPMGRFGNPEELVGAAIFLASDAAGFMTGQMIVVDGGFLASGVNQ